MKPCLVLLLLAFATILPAQQPSRFDLWDADKSGFLTKEELPERLQANFDRVDKDGDGKISRDEDAAIGKGKGRPGMTPGNRPGVGPSLGDIEKKADIDYVGDGNPRHLLDLYLPKERDEDAEPLPLLIFIHGGGWKNGSKDTTWNKLRHFVSSGEFAGAAINYRLTGESHWPTQIHDCKAAIRWLRAHAEEYGYDPERFAVWGSSAGGHLVSMLGTTNGVEELEGDLGEFDEVSSDVTCVVDFYGPANMLTMGSEPGHESHNSPNSPESALVGSPVLENPEASNNASPQHWVSDDDVPFLIIHGTEDPVVAYQQSVDFEKALEAAGVSAAFISVEGAGHGKGFGPKVNEMVKTFLDQQFLGAEGTLEDGTIAAGE